MTIKISRKVTFTTKIFNMDDIDVNRILVSKKEAYAEFNSFKYFIWYNDNDVFRSLYWFFSQVTGYINKFDKNKITMSLMIKDTQLLKNYNKIWKRIEKLMKIDFNTKTTYDSIITNFYHLCIWKILPAIIFR